MLWKSHTLITFTGILAVTMNPIAAAAAVPGATFPDAVEIYTGGMFKHRTFTHWFPIYLIPMLGILYFLYRNQGIWGQWNDIWEAFQLLNTLGFWLVFVLNSLLWFLVGCLCHIVEDSLTGYIPIRTPNDEHTLRIFFYPGSPKELIFDMAFILVCFIYRASDIVILFQEAEEMLAGHIV